MDEQIDKEAAENLFELTQSINDKMKKKFMNELLDLNKLKEVIITRENLSRPRNDKLTQPIAKIEREISAKMMIAMIEAIFESRVCPQE
jgi:hypothetical protein